MMVEEKLLIDDVSMSDLLEGVPEKVSRGTVVSARVLGKSADGVLVDIGIKTEGLIPKNEFPEFEKSLPFKVGDTIPVFVRQIGHQEGETKVSWKAARELSAWDKLVAAQQADVPIEGVIRRKIKGGYVVDIGIDAFLPGSQLDTRPVRDAESWINKKVTVLISEMDRAKSNVVVSRRKWAERERAKHKEVTLATLKEGDVREGTVSSLTNFGAFVDIGGIEGLLHISDVSWQRTDKIEKHLKVGQPVKVKVLKYDPATQRISLGLKQLTPHPWEGIRNRYPVGSTVTGRVTSITVFGAFVQLEPGVEGLLHISELSWKDRNAKPQDFVKVNDTISVKVILVDPTKEKLSLSLKRTGQSPWELVKAHHPIGSRIKGPVTHLTQFGAFLMLPEGIEGLVHISDFSWTKRIRHPNEVAVVGQELEAAVMDVKPDAEKIVLSVKHLTPDPIQSLKTGKVVTGRVTAVNENAATVELSNGVEAHVRASELGENVEGKEQFPEAGQDITAKVIKVDLRDRRVDLSIRRYDKDQERQMLARYDGKKQDPLTLGEVLIETDPSEDA